MSTGVTHSIVATAIIMLALDSNATDPVDRFVAKYKKARTETQKRSIAIEVIDAEVLYMWASIEDVRKIFKPDFEEMGIDTGSNRLAIVHFVPPVRLSNPMASEIWTGWYLSLSYKPDGSIINYHLSNAGKESSMRTLYNKQKNRTDKVRDIGLPPLKGDSNEK